MRITESKLRRIIKDVIKENEMSWGRDKWSSQRDPFGVHAHSVDIDLADVGSRLDVAEIQSLLARDDLSPETRTALESLLPAAKFHSEMRSHTGISASEPMSPYREV